MRDLLLISLIISNESDEDKAILYYIKRKEYSYSDILDIYVNYNIELGVESELITCETIIHLLKRIKEFDNEMC